MCFGQNTSQNNFIPLEYFCTRLNYSNVKHGDAIYAYGGVRDRNRFNETYSFDQQLIKLDLSYSWSVLDDDQPATFVSPPNATSGPPSPLVDGSMFYDADGDIHIYGGGLAMAYASEDRPMTYPPTANRLWTWSNHDSTWNSSTLGLFELGNAPIHALCAQAAEHNLVFLLNGVLSNGSSETAYSRMVVINTQTKFVRTVDTRSVSHAAARVGGILQYLPLMGKKGALVLLGGATWHNDNMTTDQWGTMESLDSIYIFDIASLEDTQDGIWYEQRTGGRTPEPRISTCGVSIPSPDNTNYHIYMSSGRSSIKTYDDIWVLSLPQFHWTQLFAGERPNYGAACHLVGKKQMLVLGGIDEDHTACGAAPYVALFEMTNLKWVRSYVKEDQDFRVPKAIYEWIGGSAMGGARMRTPEGGFSSPGLANMFEKLNVVQEKTSGGISRLDTTTRWEQVTLTVVWVAVSLLLL
ncbi:Nn.00g032180.m01.CDS01 [Neocucurbitaria sp. VM-36]